MGVPTPDMFLELPLLDVFGRASRRRSALEEEMCKVRADMRRNVHKGEKRRNA
ncbi:hypothetical protein NG702_04475 [Pseudarthrobacter sp. MDT3-28]|uniref:hypothetical protein n=1 Tax=Pseudarthrobacter raffinosi TaxID=2953651 RepID=UPI00208DE052|nr:hypothetical protein [Pseudarthrobacter sp. MDT3-28]MCO4236685.1 hypothetical protein [Pseudarthrobacter sp. MDT3-28]